MGLITSSDFRITSPPMLWQTKDTRKSREEASAGDFFSLKNLAISVASRAPKTAMLQLSSPSLHRAQCVCTISSDRPTSGGTHHDVWGEQAESGGQKAHVLRVPEKAMHKDDDVATCQSKIGQGKQFVCLDRRIRLQR